VKRPPGVILLIPTGREFDRGLRRGIVQYAQLHGPWTFHEEAPAYLHGLTRSERLRSLRNWRADGVILLQARLADVRPLRIPMVVSIETRRLRGSATQIVCDDDSIGAMAAETLMGLGLRNFAYCGLKGLEFSDVRCQGFRRAIEKAGHLTHVYSPRDKHPARSWHAQLTRIGRWVAALRKPVGIFACNDDRARMLSEVCRLREIRVPDDVAILGVDNDQQVCGSANPPLSSIALATERAGFEAAAFLDELMKGRGVGRGTVVVRPTHVVSRQSTDTLAIDDAGVARALRFIKDNANKDLRVADLPSTAGISRRALQGRFQRYLGRTPLEEIHRCRVERMKRLLVETDMTSRDIAAASGFEADAHFSRFFSRQAGLTPREYRRRNRTS
jgi:LacI family transcriptional regulator